MLMTWKGKSITVLTLHFYPERIRYYFAQKRRVEVKSQLLVTEEVDEVFWLHTKITSSFYGIFAMHTTAYKPIGRKKIIKCALQISLAYCWRKVSHTPLLPSYAIRDLLRQRLR